MIPKFFSAWAIAFVFLLLACSEKSDKQAAALNATRQAPPSLSVDVMIIETDQVDDKIYSTGTLLPNEEVELRPEISGRVVGIYFEEGTLVKKGQLLAKIDDSELKAQLKKLTVQEKLVKSEEDRQNQLLKINAISQEEYDIALNQLNTLEAEIELIATQIEKTSLITPFSGTIGLRYSSQGSYVTPSSLIATIQQTDPIKVEFTVPEKYVGEIKEGTEVNFGVVGTNNLYSAKVYAIDSKIDINTRTVKVRARSDNRERTLKPGAFAKVEVILKTYEDAILVPTEAIVTELEGQKVFISKGGKAKSQKIKTGIRTERVVQILEGLRPKDTVLLTGLLSVEEGVQLEIKELKTPKLEVDITQPNISL